MVHKTRGVQIYPGKNNIQLDTNEVILNVLYVENMQLKVEGLNKIVLDKNGGFYTIIQEVVPSPGKLSTLPASECIYIFQVGGFGQSDHDDVKYVTSIYHEGIMYNVYQEIRDL